ncbi:MAG: hypothetical protein DRG78_02600 [Epsilonproteobacteria bacterium]|nr:MAG: hypothetical protein DRG78_02600 [Campylobacterota bacterium]
MDPIYIEIILILSVIAIFLGIYIIYHIIFRKEYMLDLEFEIDHLIEQKLIKFESFLELEKESLSKVSSTLESIVFSCSTIESKIQKYEYQEIELSEKIIANEKQAKIIQNLTQKLKRIQT